MRVIDAVEKWAQERGIIATDNQYIKQLEAENKRLKVALRNIALETIVANTKEKMISTAEQALENK